jgi:regulator of sirC expression with transglutaminase-like and TPR domain
VDETARFVEVVHREEPTVPLDEAVLLIAAHGRPGLDVEAELDRLDELAGTVWAPTLDALRKRLFVELGFTGNQADYYDPRNSFLDQVLERRVGLPITLAVLMLEVGRRIGVPLAGISMPGHFLVRDKVDPSVFVDPFARGAVLDERGCRARFHQVHGPAAEFDPSFLEPVGKLAIVGRVLANLETIATMAGERDMLSWVLTLRAAMPDAGTAEHRKLASVLASSGRYDRAADVLEGLAGELPDPAAAQQLTSAALVLRAKLN